MYQNIFIIQTKKYTYIYILELLYTYILIAKYAYIYIEYIIINNIFLIIITETLQFFFTIVRY